MTHSIKQLDLLRHTHYLESMNPPELGCLRKLTKKSSSVTITVDLKHIPMHMHPIICKVRNKRHRKRLQNRFKKTGIHSASWPVWKTITEQIDSCAPSANSQ